MIDSGALMKLFVRVPAGTTGFNGATVSAGSSKIYFEEDTNTIWAKGDGYGISDALKQQISNLATAVGATTDEASTTGSLYGRVGAALAAIATLQGSDNTSYSIRQIAQDVVDTAFGLADEDNTINKVNEVLAWFAGVSETSYGDALIQSVANNTTAIGQPATFYEDGDEIPEGKQIGDVKTAATGLYAEIARTVGEHNVSADGDEEYITAYTNGTNTVHVRPTSSLTTAITNANNAVQSVTIGTYTLDKTTSTVTTSQLKSDILGDLAGSSYMDNNGVRVDVTSSQGEVTNVVVDASYLAGRVNALEQFDPWETYPQQQQSEPEPEP